MIRDDKSKYLLFLDPPVSDKSQIAMNDEFTEIMRMALHDGVLGVSAYSNTDDDGYFKPGDRYKGVHILEDGTVSANYDIQLPGDFITNSLCVYYLMWYRKNITANDWDKIKDIQRYYGKMEQKKM